MTEADLDLCFGLKGAYLSGKFSESVSIEKLHKKSGFIIEPTVQLRFDWFGDRRYSLKFHYVFPVGIDSEINWFFPYNVGLGLQF